MKFCHFAAIQFEKQFLDDYKPVELKIWRTFTDTTIERVLKINKIEKVI